MVSRVGLPLVAACCAGCVLYTPGSFNARAQKTGFVGQRATVGCLDLAIDRRQDHDGAAVLAYKFGNRCDSPQTIDLANVRVVGRDSDGGEVDLRPFDPTLEIRPLSLDARLVGGEVLAYHAQRELAQVCVDAASLARRTPALWMCFARPADPLPPDNGEPEELAPDEKPAAADAPSERLVEAEVTP